MGRKQPAIDDNGSGRITNAALPGGVFEQPNQGGDRRAGQPALPGEAGWQSKFAADLYECPEHKSGLHSSAAKNELKGLIKSRVTDPESLVAFRSFMCDFEKRKKAGQLSSAEIDNTYRQVSRLLEKRGTGYTSEGERLVLAKQILENAAYPQPIFQGNHNTCAPSVLESRMWTRNPSDAAQLIAEVSLTGQYQSKSGQTVKIPAINLRLDRDSGISLAQDEVRSYASQIFQAAATNVFWKTAATDPDKVRYVQIPHTYEDSGERLQEKNGNRWITLSDSPLANDLMYRHTYAQIAGPEKTKQHFVISPPGAENPGAVTAYSTQELKRTLMSMRSELPLITAVHTSNEPFASDLNKQQPGWHAILISDIDENGFVTIPSSWDSKLTRKLHVSQVFTCMFARGNKKYKAF